VDLLGAVGMSYSIRIEYKEGLMYHGDHGVRCDIYAKDGDHLSYGWGGDKSEALFFAEDTLYRNLGLVIPEHRKSDLGLDAARRIGNVLDWTENDRGLLYS